MGPCQDNVNYFRVVTPDLVCLQLSTAPWSKWFHLFGRPFVKRFALCYQTAVCLSILSCMYVCNVRILWPYGWRDQDETWRARRPRSWPHCVRWGPAHPLKGHSPSPPYFHFRPISVAAKWLHGSRCHLVWS